MSQARGSKQVELIFVLIYFAKSPVISKMRIEKASKTIRIFRIEYQRITLLMLCSCDQKQLQLKRRHSDIDAGRLLEMTLE